MFQHHAGDRIRVAVGLGRIDHQHTVDGYVAAAGQQGLADLLGRGFLAQVEHRLGAGVGGQLRGQCGQDLGAQTGHFEAEFADAIGRQHAGATAVGDDRQVLADRAIARGQALGGREQLGEFAHPHHAGAAQHRFKHVIRADDRGRMGQCSLGAGGAAARLHHHHRLGIGGGAQRAHEAAGVVNAFHVDQDALGGAVVGQEVQHLRQIDPGVGAERDHGRKADPVLASPVEDRRGQRARLRHQRQLSGRSHRAECAGVELEVGALKAQAVGAEQVHAVAAGDGVQLIAQRLRQAGGQHHRALAADAAGDLQRLCDLLVGQGDQGQIGARVRQIGQRALVIAFQIVQ